MAQAARSMLQELRASPTPELVKRLEDLRKDYVQLRLKAKSLSLDKPHRLRLIKRHIAQTLTVLHERPQGQQRA